MIGDFIDALREMAGPRQPVARCQVEKLLQHRGRAIIRRMRSDLTVHATIARAMPLLN